MITFQLSIIYIDAYKSKVTLFGDTMTVTDPRRFAKKSNL